MSQLHLFTTLLSIPPKSLGEVMGSIGGWGQYVMVYFFHSLLLTHFLPLILASYCSPAPEWVLQGLQSPSGSAIFFHDCVSSYFPTTSPSMCLLCVSPRASTALSEKSLSRGRMCFSGWWQSWYAMGHSIHVRADWMWHRGGHSLLPHRAPGSPLLPKPCQLCLIHFTPCFCKILCECI